MADNKIMRKSTVIITEDDSDTIARLKRMRAYAQLTQEEFAQKFEIPVRTYQKWENGDRTPPDYVVHMMEIIMDM